MSIESMAVVLNHANVKGTAKLVLLGIANHDGDGGAWPTMERLARYASVDERNVQRAIERLVSAGLVVVESREGGDRDCPEHRRPNRYVLRVECPPWCDRTTQHRDTRKLAGRQTTLPVIHRGGASATPSAPPPGASATPPPGASATQTVHRTQPPSLGTEPQPAREAPCADCGKSEYHCQRQQTHWHRDERHPYRPLAVRHAKG